MTNNQSNSTDKDKEWKGIKLTPIKEEEDSSNKYSEFKQKSILELDAAGYWQYVDGPDYSPPAIPELRPSQQVHGLDNTGAAVTITAVANLEGMCGTPVPHKNITLGVPHLKEIINAATNIKTLCPTTVYLKPDIWLLMHSSAFSACFRLVFQRRWSINAGGFEAEAAPSPLRLRGTKSRSKSKQISASPRRFASRGAPSFYHPTTNRGHLPPRRFALPWRSLVRATQPPTGSRSASIACPFALPRRSFVVLTELHFHALLVVPLLQRASFVVPPSHARAPFVVPGPLARPSPRPGLLCSSLTPSHATRASSPSSHAPRSSSPSAVVSRPRLLVVPAFPRDSTRTSSPPSHACARRPRGSALPPSFRRPCRSTPALVVPGARARRPRRPRSSSPPFQARA
ncbi:hypothetical protein C8R46DRAFT_1223987, partial [Mycena filopes]